MAYSSQEWMDKGNCVGINPDLFFPGRGFNIEIREAKKVCSDCPVTEECLEFALKEGIKHGIWGGKSERERRRLRTERRRANLAK